MILEKIKLSKKEVFVLSFNHKDNEDTAFDRSKVSRYVLIIDFIVSAAFFVLMVMNGVSDALRVMNSDRLSLLQFSLIVFFFFIAGLDMSNMYQDWNAYTNRFIFKSIVKKRMVKRSTNSKIDSKRKNTR